MKTIRTSVATTGTLLYLKSTLWGILLGSITIIILLLLFSTVLLISGTLPHDILVWLDLSACGLGCYIAGYTASRITKHNGLLSGALCGICMFLILLLAGFIYGGNLTYMILFKLMITLLMSVIGAVKGVNKKEKIKIR